MAPREQVRQPIPESVQEFISKFSNVFGDKFTVLEVREREKDSPCKPEENPVVLQTSPSKLVKSAYGIIEALALGIIKNFTRYKEQVAFIIEGYCPKRKQVVDIKLFKTQESYKRIVESYRKRNLYPLLFPNPVKVPKEFWERYKKAKNGYERLKIVKEFGLLADGSILQLRTLTIDIDSEFEKVLPAWEELREKLGIQEGYTVVKTKSGRFRAYISLKPTEVTYVDKKTKEQRYRQFYLSTKHLKRAQEFVSIILSYFEKKGLEADHTFSRLNHPIFPEGIDYYGKTYEVVESKSGYAGKFYDLYKGIKQLQREENLWYLGKTYLPKKFWGKKERKVKEEKKECEVIKAPALKRILDDKQLDLLELWKKAVWKLSSKHDSCRYTHVIQPAIGWAKYLGLPEEEVTEILIYLLGEEKRKDIEKGWKYAKELEFHIPDNLGVWAGKRREEWEKEVRRFLKANNGVAFRQTLIKDVFKGQEWLTDLIMWGMVKKGIVEWRKYWEKEGRGRKPYVFALRAESEALPKAVGAEEYIPNWLNGKKTVGITEKEKTLNNNSSLKGEEQRSGLEVVGKSEDDKIKRKDNHVLVCSRLQEDLEQFLDRYFSLRFDFQARAKALQIAVRGRVKMQTLMRLWEKDKELYRKLWSLLELFRIIELPQQDAIELIVPKDVAVFVKRVYKVYLGSKDDGS